MHTFQSTRGLPVLLLLLTQGGVGCGEDPDTTAPVNVRLTGGVTAGERLSGSRTLQATAEDDSGGVARMEFYVSDTLACADATARASGDTFSCTWDSSRAPAGDHTLTARARDAAGNTASSPPLSLTVLPPNRAPTVQQVSASRTALDEGSSLTLSVSAQDPDGQPLTYTWTQLPASPPGTFGPETGTTRTWTAPLLSQATRFTLRVTASDGKGGTAQGAVEVAVANVPALNQPPNVDETIELPAARRVAGDSIALFVGARDWDGDPLTYRWKTSPEGEGTFTTPTSSLARWRSPDLGTDTSYTLQVTVSDGTASVTRSVSVRIERPSYAQDIQPLWSPGCTSCHNDSSGTFGALNLLAAGAYDSLLHQNGPGACGATKRVIPGQPDESLLVQRISGEGCGRRMPQGDSSYFDRNPGELTRIRSWILAGAPND